MSTVTLQRKGLVEALKVATRIVTQKLSGVPVLAGVRLTVNGDVRLAATDLDYGAVMELARAGGIGDADMVLPAARLYAQVRAGRGESVTLEQADGFTARLDGTAAVVGFDPADFPALPAGPEGELVGGLDAAELAAALKAVGHSVSTEAVRYALTGVLLDLELDKRDKVGRACLVASDGKRLARWRMKGAVVKRAARIIVPTKALHTVAELTARAGKGATVKVYVEAPKGNRAEQSKAEEVEDPTRVHFALPGAGVFSRIIEGNFPDHGAVTPQYHGRGWEVEAGALAGALAAVAPVLTDKTRAVRFEFGGGKVKLFAKSQDVGEARAEAPAEGECELTVTLCPDYILDFLRGLPKGLRFVRMQGKDRTTATLWHGPAGHEYVVMPLTVNL